MWNYKTPGIPDEHFERAEKVPITKEEVRVIMEEFGDTTESLYLYIANNYNFRKLTKQKTTQLLKARI